MQIHRFDENVPIEETMEALHDLVKSGKVRYIGASSMWAVQFAQMQFVAEKNGKTIAYYMHSKCILTSAQDGLNSSVCRITIISCTAKKSER